MAVRALAIAALTLCAACAGDGSGGAAPAAAPTTVTPADLAGTDWGLTELQGEPIANHLAWQLGFGEAGEFHGRSGCNRFHGTARIEEGRVVFGPVAGTRMACMPGVMEQETRFHRALAAAGRLEREGDVLLVLGDGPDPLLRFRKQ